MSLGNLPHSLVISISNSIKVLHNNAINLMQPTNGGIIQIDPSATSHASVMDIVLENSEHPKDIRISGYESHLEIGEEMAVEIGVSDKRSDSIPMSQLLVQLNGIEEKVLLAQNGYHKIRKICDTLQGEVIKAKMCKLKNNKEVTLKSNHHVFIKKCDKILEAEHVSYADEDEMHFVVDDSIIKEKLILKYLTVDNVPTADYIVKYIDFFESENDFYLVTECMNNGINLKEFTLRVHKYIKSGKLKVKQYQKVLKFIMWQICAVIYWLHNDMHCCHLNLCMESVILQNVEFIEGSDGLIVINPAINVKLCDFSKSEVFEPNDIRYRCMKYPLSTDVQYLSPKIYAEQIYDARSSDMWSLGMILYECAVNEPLYCFVDESRGSGYWAVMEMNLKIFISTNNFNKLINHKMVSMLECLLNIDESKRMNVAEILKHEWFKSYYKKYEQRIQKKSLVQKKKLIQQQQQMLNFPFYACKY